MTYFKDYIKSGKNDIIRFKNEKLKDFVNNFIDFDKYADMKV